MKRRKKKKRKHRNDDPIFKTIVHWVLKSERRRSAERPGKERSGIHDRESIGFFVIAFRFTLPKKKVSHCGWVPGLSASGVWKSSNSARPVGKLALYVLRNIVS